MQHRPANVPRAPRLARRLRIVVRDREVANIFDYVPRTSAGVVMLTNAAGSAQCMTTSRADNDAANRKCGDQALGVEKENSMLRIKRGAALLVSAALGLGAACSAAVGGRHGRHAAQGAAGYAVGARRSRLCRCDVQEHQRHAARPDGSRIQRPHHARWRTASRSTSTKIRRGFINGFRSMAASGTTSGRSTTIVRVGSWAGVRLVGRLERQVRAALEVRRRIRRVPLPGDGRRDLPIDRAQRRVQPGL